MPGNTTRHLDLSLEQPFRLEDGGELREIRVAYESYGKMHDEGANTILLCHALTMDAHVTDNGDESLDPGWWNFFVGPGKAIDTTRYHVLCFNVLGGCMGTTGPASINPDSGEVYRTDFPNITIEDMVRVQKLALDHLGIRRLFAVIGGSLGGMQTLEWTVRYPDFLRHAVVIASGACLSTQGLAFDIVGRECIVNDPDWNNGHYDPSSPGAMTGLASARMIGHITYITKQVMETKFGRRLQEGMIEKDFSTAFAIESFLRYQGEKFVKRFDPNSYLYITKAMDTYDLKEENKSLSESLQAVQCDTLLISYSSDWLFPPDNSREVALALSKAGKPASHICIETDLGHDAFLVNDEKGAVLLEKLIRAFLGKEEA